MRTILIAGLTVMACSAMGQSIEEAKQHLYHDRLQSAEQILQQVLPQEKEAYYWLAEVYLEEKKVDKAKSLLNSNADILSAHPLNKVAFGSVLLAENQTAEAKAQFDQALKDANRKTEVEVLKAIARAHVENKAGDANAAIQLISQIKDKSLDAEAVTLRGDAYRKLNQGSEAAKAYMEALLMDEKYAQAAYNLGKIYMTQQNSEMFLKYFNQAVAADPKFAAAYYELYYYYYFRDVNKAQEYLDLYVAHTDPSIEHQYMKTDLMFASAKYDEAISGANAILEKEGDQTRPRLYKLLAYSHDAKGDSTKAFELLNTYFAKEVDSNVVAKDYDLQAKLYKKMEQDSLAALAWEKAISIDTVVNYKLEYMQQLAQLYKENNNRSGEAKWLANIFATKPEPNNLDLYNWGLAHYAAAEFHQADTVFGKYTEKYPDQVYGFYWRAKSRAQIDTTMEQGLAVADYKKVAEIAETDKEKNKSLLIQAYGYLGAYEANVTKDYTAALGWFEKILVVQPDNADAQKFADILKKWIEEGKGQTKAE
jgi:tetratricopeptide (TPR) repeat protein